MGCGCVTKTNYNPEKVTRKIVDHMNDRLVKAIKAVDDRRVADKAIFRARLEAIEASLALLVDDKEKKS